MDEKSDYTLIHGYMNGDSSAFTLLYERYKRPLYSYIRKMLCGRVGLEDDIFQQTWLHAIRSFSSYQDQDKFLAWLMRIAHNLIINYYRMSVSKKEISLSSEMEETMFASKKDSPEKEFENKNLNDIIDSILRNMDSELREVFILRQRDISFREIAQIQKCSINTCLSRMQYAVKKIRKELIEMNIR